MTNDKTGNTNSAVKHSERKTMQNIINLIIFMQLIFSKSTWVPFLSNEFIVAFVINDRETKAALDIKGITIEKSELDSIIFALYKIRIIRVKRNIILTAFKIDNVFLKTVSNRKILRSVNKVVWIIEVVCASLRWIILFFCRSIDLKRERRITNRAKKNDAGIQYINKSNALPIKVARITDKKALNKLESMLCS